MGRLIACVLMLTGIILFSVGNGSIILVMGLPRVPIDLTGHRDPRLKDATVCSTYGAFELYLADHNRFKRRSSSRIPPQNAMGFLSMSRCA